MLIWTMTMILLLNLAILESNSNQTAKTSKWKMWRKLNRMKTKSKTAQKQSSYTRDKLWSPSWQFCECHHYLSCSLDTEFVSLVHTGALALGDIWQLVYHSTNNSGHLESCQQLQQYDPENEMGWKTIGLSLG